MSHTSCRVALLFALILVPAMGSPHEAFAQESPHSRPIEWREGQRAPDGLVVRKSKVGKTLVIAGSTVLGIGYLEMAGLGLGGEVLCATWPGGEKSRGSCAAIFAQSFIPIAGPFLFLGEGGGGGSWGRMLVVSAVLQSAGAVTVITGLALDATATQRLVPDSRSSEHARSRVDVVPMIGGAVTGAMVVGSF